MLLTSLPLVLAGAGLAFQQVAASPLRVVVVTSHQEITSNAQVGSDAANVAAIVRPEMIIPHPIFPELHIEDVNGAGHHGRRPCKSLKDKAISLSNKFRVTFGFAPIDPHPHPPPALPILTPGFRTGPVFSPGEEKAVEEAVVENTDVTRTEHRIHHHHHRVQGTFMGRLHHAIMALGPWEGRAIAFVLGCGLGVLLRMFWVMTIVTLRFFAGGNSTRDAEDITQGDLYYHGVVVFESDADAEELPPQYPVDEKAALVAADKVAEQN